MRRNRKNPRIQRGKSRVFISTPARANDYSARSSVADRRNAKEINSIDGESGDEGREEKKYTGVQRVEKRNDRCVSRQTFISSRFIRGSLYIRFPAATLVSFD